MHENPVAIVTGAGRMRGIGKATAQLLARDGFTVVVTERAGAEPTDAEQAAGWKGAQTLIEQIMAAGGSAKAISCDISETGDVQSLVDAAVELGPLAVVVNNAATAGSASSFALHETPRPVWDEAVAVNLTALWVMAGAASPALMASSAPHKAIVNLSSLAASRPLPHYAGYNATKAGVEALTRQMALELARYGVRVNCVSPGSTDTDMIEGTLQRADSRVHLPSGSVRATAIKRIPLRRFAEPFEVAEVIRFLAGERASYITGQVLQVDGGLSLV